MISPFKAQGTPLLDLSTNEVSSYVDFCHLLLIVQQREATQGSSRPLHIPAKPRSTRQAFNYLSGLFPGPAAEQLQEPMSVRGGPAPLPGAGVRIPGRGLGTRAALASSHAPRPAPGRGRTAPPPAPAHRLTPALTHTHTPSRALTHALPSLLLCLSPPAVWGPRRSPALRLRHAVSAPAPGLTVRGYATAMALGSFLNSERGP